MNVMCVCVCVRAYASVCLSLVDEQCPHHNVLIFNSTLYSRSYSVSSIDNMHRGGARVCMHIISLGIQNHSGSNL